MGKRTPKVILLPLPPLLSASTSRFPMERTVLCSFSARIEQSFPPSLPARSQPLAPVPFALETRQRSAVTTRSGRQEEARATGALPTFTPSAREEMPRTLLIESSRYRPPCDCVYRRSPDMATNVLTIAIGKVYFGLRLIQKAL